MRELVLPSITHDEPIQVWTLDDTGFPKKGSHSVGGDPAILRPTGQTRELSGGRQLVGSDPSGQPAGGVSADLPKDWADDPGRRAAAGVPEDIAFQTKPEIALQQMRQAHADGLPAAVALMDPGYGNDAKLRAGITELEQPYVAGILPTTAVWRPGETSLPPAPWSGRGRPPTRLRRDDAHRPVSARVLAVELAADAWQQIIWQDGSNQPLSSRLLACGCARRMTTPGGANRRRKSGC